MASKAPEWRPRLTVEITPDQYQKLQNLIPWGVKNQIFCLIIDDLIELISKDPQLVIGALLARQIKLNDILKGSPDVDNR